MTDRKRRFEAAALPHLDAAYNLARWLLRDDHDARDVTQEAYLRAYRFFDGFRGGDARPWLLSIVRNACYDWLDGGRRELADVEFDETRDGHADTPGFEPAPGDPAVLLLRKRERARVNEAIAALPAAFREVIVLRELEDMSYEEIAQVLQVPAGTVMSRLSRARKALKAALEEDQA